MDARIELGGEPETPRRVEWRLAIYPFALAAGALAAAYESPPLFAVFVVLMLAPIWIKWRAWGGVGRAIQWLFRSNLRITREGYFFVALVILFGTAAINTGTNLLYLILAMLLSLMVLSTFLANLNLRGLRISRRTPGYVFAGEDVRIGLSVTNPRKRMPAFAIETRERAGPFGEGGRPAEGPPVFFFSLEPGDRRSAAVTIRIPRRGVYPLEGFSIATRFPFGFAIQFAKADLPAEIVVFPTPRELGPGAVRAIGAAADAPRPRSFIQAPEEFRSLRDYRPGDNPRWVHWRSSARAGRLLVREFEPRSSRRAALVIDPDVPVSPDATATLDRGCTLAVSLLEHLVRQGDRPEVTVQVKDEVVRFGPDAGPREIVALLDCLARLEPAADPGGRRLIEAATPPIRRGARVYVVTARDGAAVRHALERAEPAAAFSADILSFAREADVEPLYASAPAGEGAPARRERIAGAEER